MGRPRRATIQSNPDRTRRSAPLYTGIESIFALYVGPAHTLQTKLRAERLMDEFVSAMVEGKPFLAPTSEVE